MKIKSKSLFNLSVLFALLASLLGGAVTVTPARAAATWTVTSSLDVVPGVPGNCPSASCRLRDAFAASALGDTIIFDASLSGATIYLTDTLTIGDITVDGSALASKITISGDTNNDGNTTPNVQVFFIGGGAVTLNSLVITKGVDFISQGNGIYVTGGATLNILNCTITGNGDSTSFAAVSGGGIYVDMATVNITNSTISGNATSDPTNFIPSKGGGIFNSNLGTVHITNSTISGNSAQMGQAVYNDGEMNITSSTVSGHIAGLSFKEAAIYNNTNDILTVTNSVISGNTGGGFFNRGTLTITGSTISGNNGAGGIGGILNVAGKTVNIRNSTISGNSIADATAGDGGGIQNWGTLNLKNVTISGNTAVVVGGGINNLGTLNYSNTIIANSTVGGDCYNAGTIGTNTKNLVEDGFCNATLSGDPNLVALANNGGSTQTHALLVGSKAIDAGDAATCAETPPNGINNLDQRGITRLQGSACDIGAYEYDLPYVLSITRAGASPSTAAIVNFTVLFSEAVTGVNASDFTLTKTGITGASISAVSAGTNSYTVTVKTGTGNGTLRLDLVDNDSILDSVSNPLGGSGVGNGSYSAGESYTFKRLLNGGFETFTTNVPSSWKSTKFENTDGKNTIHKSGKYSVMMFGKTATTKTLKQTVPITGVAGDKLTFSFYVRGSAIPATAKCSGQVKLMNGNSTVIAQTLPCPKLTYGFKLKKVTFNASGIYNNVVVIFTYAGDSGSVWFDAVSLIK